MKEESESAMRETLQTKDQSKDGWARNGSLKNTRVKRCDCEKIRSRAHPKIQVILNNGARRGAGIGGDPKGGKQFQGRWGMDQARGGTRVKMRKDKVLKKERPGEEQR